MQASIVELRDYQKDWAESAKSNLLTHGGYVDTSKPGAGKTWVAVHIAQQLNLPVLIVCPATLKEGWTRICNDFNVKIEQIISYQSLRGTGHTPLKHDLLVKHVLDRDNSKTVIFTPTNRYKALIHKGIFVIIDEIQNIKNNSIQFKAVNELFGPLTRITRDRITNGESIKSGFGLLSGSPFDKKDHCVNLLRLLGFIESSHLFYTNPTNGNFIPRGYGELIEKCVAIDSDGVSGAVSGRIVDKKNCKDLCFSVFTKVIKPLLFGAMVRQSSSSLIHEACNTYYKPTGIDRGNILDAINSLARSLRYNAETGTINTSKITGIGRLLRDIEFSKINLFIRPALDILKVNNNNKVIISLSNHDTIEGVKKALAIFDPSILTGKTPMKDRQSIIDKFNTDKSIRVLIMNTKVGGVGVSLHDTIGDSPRFMLISPSYCLLDLYQAAGRINRDGVASNSIARIVYANGSDSSTIDTLEHKILAAINAKSAVVRDSLATEAQSSSELPSGYMNELAS
jgi:hypothetical protein